MRRSRSSLGLLFVINTRLPKLLFQAGFVGSGKRFRPMADWQMFNDKIAMHAHPLRRAGDDSDMLEPVVLLLSVATCALILLAFWGLDLLRFRRRR